MSELALSNLLRPELSEISAYVPVQGSFAVRLDANEAPPLLSPAARIRLAEAASRVAWERYPDARASELRQAIAAETGVSADEVLVGVGSDELIAVLMTVLSQPRGAANTATVVTTTPTFVMYRLSARVRGMRVIEVPLDDSWDIPTSSMVRAIDIARPSLVFIASPNNPTGRLASRDRLQMVIEAGTGCLVVIDEAYIAYAGRDQLDLFHEHDNVVVLRTLSKVGFAGLRVGWLLGRSRLVAELDKARLPYNVSSCSQRLATLVLTELAAERAHIVQRVVAERCRLSDALTELGVQVTPSDANFLWIRTQVPAEHIHEKLAARGVLVRSFHERGGRLAHQLRITIGTPEENDTLLWALREAL